MRTRTSQTVSVATWCTLLLLLFAAKTHRARALVEFGCSPVEPLCCDECPVEPDLPKCNSVEVGELCDGDGECGTDNKLNNCPGAWDIYRKVDSEPATPVVCDVVCNITAPCMDNCRNQPLHTCGLETCNSHIVDLSNRNLTGTIPTACFSNGPKLESCELSARFVCPVSLVGPRPRSRPCP